MFKNIFNKKTSKADVIMASAGALVGVWKAFDTYKTYKAEQADNQMENEK